MYIARILYPVKVLGPGNRIGIWFDGCIHHCIGCSNPELWEFQDKYHTNIKVLMSLINQISDKYPVDGFTITGGDPFLQPAALKEIILNIKHISSDILVYTGYIFEDLLEEYPEIINEISVLIDGPYMEELNNGSILRGSSNQRIFVQDAFKDYYSTYFKTATNEIQNFALRDGLISVGIHKRNFDVDFSLILEKMKEK